MMMMRIMMKFDIRGKLFFQNPIAHDKQVHSILDMKFVVFVRLNLSQFGNGWTKGIL